MSSTRKRRPFCGPCEIELCFHRSYSLKDFSGLDERVEAHLDGLRIAGQFGWQLCEQALDKEEPGMFFAAAVLAFDSGDTERIQRVLEMGCLTPELQRELISALGWLPFSKIEAVHKRSSWF